MPEPKPGARPADGSTPGAEPERDPAVADEPTSPPVPSDQPEPPGPAGTLGPAGTPGPAGTCRDRGGPGAQVERFGPGATAAAPTTRLGRVGRADPSPAGGRRAAGAPDPGRPVGRRGHRRLGPALRRTAPAAADDVVPDAAGHPAVVRAARFPGRIAPGTAAGRPERPPGHRAHGAGPTRCRHPRRRRCRRCRSSAGAGDPPRHRRHRPDGRPRRGTCRSRSADDAAGRGCCCSRWPAAVAAPPTTGSRSRPSTRRAPRCPSRSTTSACGRTTAARRPPRSWRARYARSTGWPRTRSPASTPRRAASG